MADPERLADKVEATWERMMEGGDKAHEYLSREEDWD